MLKKYIKGRIGRRYFFIIFVFIFFFFLFPGLSEVRAIHTSFHFYGGIITPQGYPVVRPNMYVAMIDSQRNQQGALRRNKRYQLVGGNSCIYDLNNPTSAHEATVIDAYFPEAGMIPCPADGQCIRDGVSQGCTPGQWTCDDARYHCDYPGWNMDNKFMFAAWQSLFVDWGDPRSNWVPPGGGQTVTSGWCNQTLSVPSVGSTKKIDKQVGCAYDSGGFGCNEDPIIFRAYIDGCDCTDCIIEDFDNITGGNGINDLAALCRDPSGNPTNGIVCTCSNNPVITNVNAPDICEGQPSSIWIDATDDDGVTDIQRFILNINQGAVNVAQFEISDGGAIWKNSGDPSITAVLDDCDTYTPGTQLWCESAVSNRVTIKPTVSGLATGNYTAQAFVYDYASNSGSGQDSFNVLVGPSANLWVNGEQNDISVPEGTPIRVQWNSSNATLCSLATDPPGSLAGVSYDCSGDRNPVSPPPSPDDYTVTFSASNSCDSFTPQIRLTIIAAANPWNMTAFGDTYARNGYDLELQRVTGYDVWSGNNDEAYFSTYIISKNTGSWPDPESYRDYTLSGYDDKNRSKVGPTNEVYSYLTRVVENNDVDPASLALPGGIPPENCNGENIYFYDGPISFSSNTYTSGPDDACVYVASGNVTVQGNVEQIDAFILTDGNFLTTASNTKLQINGGVIANNVDFNRDLPNDGSDPAEIMIYDAKYLLLLRDLLGEGFPFRVREYKLSEPTIP